MAIRPLTAEDIDAAYGLSSLAGWNQTEDDWRLILELGDTCLGIEADGRMVATATLICYGKELAWVGMVLTHPDYRRRGLARELMNEIMRRTQTLAIDTVKLDSTEAGHALYASLGFRDEQIVERWARSGEPSRGNSVWGGDADFSGHHRGTLLTRLARNGWAAKNDSGYVLERPGRLHRYLGPCMAANAGTARELIAMAIARAPAANWFWDLLPANESAVAIATDMGFAPVRRLTRMVCGHDARENDSQIFAIGGFELG